MKYFLVLSLLLAPAGWLSAANVDTALARRATWTESWPDAAGAIESREVKSEIWNDAIQAALDKDNAAFLPKRDQPYYMGAAGDRQTVMGAAGMGAAGEAAGDRQTVDTIWSWKTPGFAVAFQ